MINSRQTRTRTIAGFGNIPVVVWGLIFACLLPELILLGADWGLWGALNWRSLAYQYGGFWAGLLGNWRPNYPAQPYFMFASYGFLHAGPVHFLINMFTLLSLGPPLVRAIGAGRFLMLYSLSLIGGAVGFAALSAASAPMIGASGALFGLAGAYLAREYTRRTARALPVWPVLRAMIWLGVLNLVLWWAMHGQLAWQTHLGGFVAGWVFIAGYGTRRRSV
ncbi:MAG: rhomboid family intramembrane serine protease [Albidovulum sp.]